MASIRVITDSSCDLSKTLIEKYGITDNTFKYSFW